MTNLHPNDHLEVFSQATDTISEASVSAAISKVLQAGANVSIVSNTDGTITITPTFEGMTTIYVDGTSVAGAGTSAFPLHMIGLPTNIGISPTVLTVPTYGVFYTEQLSHVGGSGAVTYSVAQALPNGLSLSSNGLLSGTPTTIGTYNFVVTATDSVGTIGKHNYTLTVSSVPLVISPPLLPSALDGTEYSQILSVTGGSEAGYVFDIDNGALPVGLSLNGSTIFGMPTAIGSTYFMISATDSAGNTGHKYYTLGVNGSVALSPSGLSNGAASSTYAQQIVATGGTNSQFTFAVTSGALPSGLTLSVDGNLQGVPTAMGSYNFTITATDSVGNTGTQSYTIVISNMLSLSPSILGNCAVSTTYTQNLTAAGGSGSGYVINMARGYLPAGLTLTSGTISGSATETGSFSFSVRVTDSEGSSFTQDYTIVVTAVALSLSALSAVTATVGVEYSQIIYAIGGTGTYNTYWVSTGAIPPGMSFIGHTLSGSPSAAGNYNFSISAVDSAGDTGTQVYSINVSNPYVAMTPRYVFDGATAPIVRTSTNCYVGGGAPLPAWGQGTAGYFYATVHGGVGPYTYAMRNDGFSNAVATIDSTGLVTFVNASAAQQLTGTGFDGITVVVTDSTGAQLPTTYYFTTQS